MSLVNILQSHYLYRVVVLFHTQWKKIGSEISDPYILRACMMGVCVHNNDLGPWGILIMSHMCERANALFTVNQIRWCTFTRLGKPVNR